MALANSLLPRSILVAETFSKLSGINQGFQDGWQTNVNSIGNSYELDKLDEADLLNLMASFDLLDLYDSLPPYYQGSPVHDDGSPYSPPQPFTRIGFMRTFIREMLRMRNIIGIVKIFDNIMGMFTIPVGKFTVLQTFRYGNSLDPDPTHVNSGIYDVTEDRVIYSTAHIQGLYDPAPCYRRYGSLVYDPITNPIPGVIDPSSPDWTPGPFDPLPLGMAAFAPDISGKRYTPTQTVTVDVLSVIPVGILSDFIKAVRLVVNFLKPTWVVFKDITPTVYLQTDQFYQMSESLKGQYVVPQPPNFSFVGEQGAPDYRIDFTDEATASNATNKIFFSTINPVSLGLRPGMIINISGFTNGVNNTNKAQIDSIGNDYIHIRTSDAVLITEGPVASIKFHGDYDHSFQDALVPIEGLSITKTGVFSIVTNTVFRNDAVPGVTGFDVDGFSVNKLIRITGFTNDLNNVTDVSQAVITQVGNDFLVTSYAQWVTESAGAKVVTIEMVEDYDMADPDPTLPKPFIEDRSDTLLVPIHEPGPIPTLASGGSYNAQSASSRTDRLDTSHYDNLGSRIGGTVWFGDAFNPAPFSSDDSFIVTDGLGGNLLVTEGFGDN